MDLIAWMAPTVDELERDRAVLCSAGAASIHACVVTLLFAAYSEACRQGLTVWTAEEIARVHQPCPEIDALFE